MNYKVTLTSNQRTAALMAICSQKKAVNELSKRIPTPDTLEILQQEEEMLEQTYQAMLAAEEVWE